MRSINSEFYKSIFLGIFSYILLLGLLYSVITKMIIEQKLETAKVETKTVIAYRHYLSLIAPKIKILDSNISPFAITPAYVTSQVSKILRNKGFYIKQTSDDYRDYKNKPDKVELYAIEFFRKNKNKKEFFNTYKDENGKAYLFYARRLLMEKSCLKCHGEPYKDVPPDLYKKIIKIYGNKGFGYKEGDVRGILSIKIPYEYIIKKVNKIFILITILSSVFFIMGLIVFTKLNKSIREDINKFLNHFKITKEGRYPILKDKMNFLEFKELKDEINKTFLKLKKYEGSVYRKFYFHNLTNLPNRNKFLECIKENKSPIVLINADKFKEINFYFGNRIGDELIKSVANRLNSLKKEFNFRLFHINIDEFALIFKNPNISKTELVNDVRKILDILEEPYNIESNEIMIRFRAGVSFFQKDYQRAEIALDMAKELKKDIVFAKDIKNLDKYEEHLKWLRRLQWALKNDRIVPFYQPIVDKNKNIIKYEVLVRFIGENGEIVTPFFFLDIAKKSRYYLEITKRVIEKALKKVKEKNIAVSINLTLEDIEDRKMRRYILNKLSDIEDKSKITFEIVESEDVRNNETVKKFLNRLKSLGCLIYIDDFGSGYSNFDYILKLKSDGIKIDGSLIKDIVKDKNAQIIVKTIVSFAKEMNIKTVAEYVENKETFEFLKNLGIDYFQGFYFSISREDI